MEIVGSLQIRVLHQLWDHGPATVVVVHRILNTANLALGRRPIAYTTVLTVMRNLARRGIISQTATGRAHIFAPLITRASYCQGLLAHIRTEVFGGDVRTMLVSLAADETLDPDLRRSLQSLALAT